MSVRKDAQSPAWQVVSGNIARGGGACLQKLVLQPQKEHLLEFLACWPLLRQEEGVGQRLGPEKFHRREKRV